MAKSGFIERLDMDGRGRLAVGGAWTVGQAAELERASSRLAASGAASHIPQVEFIEAAAIEELDTFGCLALDALRKKVVPGHELPIKDLPDKYQRLFAQVGQIAHGTGLEKNRKANFTNPLAFIGASAENAVVQMLDFAGMLGKITLSLLRVSRRPSSFRLTSTTYQLDRIGWQAIPIILLITFLIGSIIAQQGFFHLRKFAADEYVVDMVGILILREIGVLLVAIMVAGRSGSACTAELGSMKMREEIDALLAMGLDPVEVLALPRVVALTLALPMLAFLGCMAALYGGGLTAWLYAGMSPEIFVARLKDAISIEHFEVGMIKAPFMALVIGTVACAEGFAVRGSAESLGRRTTASVVKSIFFVIVLDGLFAIFFASIGM